MMQHLFIFKVLRVWAINNKGLKYKMNNFTITEKPLSFIHHYLPHPSLLLKKRKQYANILYVTFFSFRKRGQGDEVKRRKWSGFGFINSINKHKPELFKEIDSHILLFIILVANILSLNGQSTYPDSLLCSNHIFNENIKTVHIYKEGWNLSYPIIRLNTDEKLILHFDLLDDQAETYNYTFIHCDKDWNKTDIFPDRKSVV